jgi:hypothetical protein
MNLFHVGGYGARRTNGRAILEIAHGSDAKVSLNLAHIELADAADFNGTIRGARSAASGSS